MKEGYELSEDPAYKLSRDEKGCRIRVDGRGHYFATRDDKILYTSIMEITGQEIFCTVREADGSTSVIVGKNPEEEPLEGLAETEIQIYNHPEIKQKITESLFYTDEKGQRKPTPFAAVLRDCVKNRLAQKNSKNPGIDEILGAVNELKDGTLEEQAVYGMFRAHLVENRFMPIDENGRPYDLSAMHIPVFNSSGYIRKLMLDDPETAIWIWGYYENKRKERQEKIKESKVQGKNDATKENQEPMTEEDFARTMENLKTDAPDKYVEMHQYLVDNGYITPIIHDLNLSPEQLEFILSFHKAGRYEYLTPAGKNNTGFADQWLDAVFTFLNYSLKQSIQKRIGQEEADKFDILEVNPAWISKYSRLISRQISQLRFGDWEDRETYNNFCGLVKDLHNTIILEQEPTYPEEARSMFTRAQAKQARATIETKL